jgi:hypothetical protein
MCLDAINVDFFMNVLPDNQQPEWSTPADAHKAWIMQFKLHYYDFGHLKLCL